MSTECDRCAVKDALIEKLLDRLALRQEAVEAEGESLWEATREDSEEDDSAVAVAAEVTNAFRSIHDVSPYAGCAIVSGGEEKGIEE